MARILIIDDSSMSRRILRTILESAGHEVAEAADGMVGLEQYFLQKPDVVLLDLIMTGMFGMDVLKKLREMDPNARVIVATADIQVSTREMTDAQGAAGFVTKPFSPENVLQVVDSALRTG
jgi:two-component system, chemotaxis family, chemotaxis protein CheY